MSASLVRKKKQNLLLLRDFLRLCLYHKTDGYFQKKGGFPVGTTAAPMCFRELINSDDYRSLLERRYNSLRGKKQQFLTPIEIFKPHFGNAIARYILDERNKTNKLVILEIGGGTGTSAVNILDYIRLHDNTVYQRMRFGALDVSEISLQLQEKLIRAHSHDVVWFRSKQPIDVTKSAHAQDKSWLEIARKLEGNTDIFVIALEVMDNLVHDKVVFDKFSHEWFETRVDVERKLEIRECLKDEEIKFVLPKVIKARKSSMWNRMRDAVFQNHSTTIFLPTGLSMALKNLRKNLPRHRLVFADFDDLPDSKMMGINAPLVRGKTHDRESYLHGDIGECDVFFPTCFETLRLLNGENGDYIKSSEFMQIHADVNACRTMSGYNPLISDFSNTAFFLT